MSAPANLTYGEPMFDHFLCVEPLPRPSTSYLRGRDGAVPHTSLWVPPTPPEWIDSYTTASSDPFSPDHSVLVPHESRLPRP